MTIYCPTCNRSSDEVRFIGNFCQICIAEKLSRKIPEKVIIKQCRFCERIKTREGFAIMSANNIGKVIVSEFKLKDCKAKVKERTKDGATVEFRCFVDESVVAFDKEISIKVEHETCQDCYRRSSGYFEALVQLRGTRSKVDKLVERIKKYAERGGAFVSKTEELEGGIDVYVSDKLLMNEFFKYYRLKPKRSYTLYGMKKGREVYRNVYALHL
ncbi:MAG: hypothetical protein KGH60_02880 [Candidatus Micrarchaeota archaeon]|nr:hypothetical protein [Candidatus Micrarchaeota archaeon]